ncbi:MAG: cytochrome-c peroxidase [Nannocystales bacterium]
MNGRTTAFPPGCTRRLAALTAVLSVALGACAPQDDDEPLPPSVYADVEEFGEALFFDENLSMQRTQSCATCHDPQRAFTDGRLDAQGNVRAVSLGDDGVSLGDRNAPSAAYAFLSPEFHVGVRERHNKQNNHRLYMGPLGGQFWDGRVPGLESQAGGPPLNPLEMGMPDPASVAQRLDEDTEHRRALFEFFGQEALDDDDVAYAAMTEAVAAYERTEVFAPFDSRYDRSLRGEVALTFKELTGKAIFFSQFGNCAVCHQLYSEGDPINETRETFTGYEFHNIGVPANEAVRLQNGVTAPDEGLLGNDDIDDPMARGAFKTPTLRNVAVTGPYMHNGVFGELRTVVEFYDHFTNADERPVNPETGEAWRAPEVPDTVRTELLQVGDPMTDTDVEGLVCFLRALTDQRYEALIPSDGIDCG